jgi:hypothetical protein
MTAKAPRKSKQIATNNNQLRTSCNRLSLLALQIVERIEPLARERLLDNDERHNLTLAKDIIVSVRRLKLEEKRIKANAKQGEREGEALEKLPEVTDDLRKLAAQLVLNQRNAATAGKQTAFRSERKAKRDEEADA